MLLPECIPKDKFDVDAIARAKKLGFPDINPILPELLDWIQDINWPVASPAIELLAFAGPEIVPHVSAILRSDDNVWKYNVLIMVMELEGDILRSLESDLSRLSAHPTESEVAEELDVLAGELLLRI